MKVEDIKFKAKSILDEAWVQGDLIHKEDGKIAILRNGFNVSEVDPSTVCQFTGLKDKNGVEVYENDIVKAVDWEETICNVEYKDYGFCLCGKCFREGIMPLFVAVGNCDIYVIGNKFDRRNSV